MARIFISGSTDGLGLAAARNLLDAGHEVVLHGRSRDCAAAVDDLTRRAAGVVVGDFTSATETRRVAEQVDAIGQMDAVIHNAGTYLQPSRGATPEGHATTFAVNSLAPFILTALMRPPGRLIYVSSEMHRGGEGSLRDIDWVDRPWDAAQAYAESKLHVAALAFAVARRWPKVLSNAVNPGWVRTRMGGPDAPVDVETGQRTQTWLATSNEPAALVSGAYWRNNLQQQPPAAEVMDAAFQDRLMAKLAELTGVGPL